jgi:hypothetical protein
VRGRLDPKDVEDRWCDLPGITLNGADVCCESRPAEQRETFRPMIAGPMHCLLSTDNAESI